MKSFLSGLFTLIVFNLGLGALAGATIGAWCGSLWNGALIGAAGGAMLAILEYFYAFWRYWDKEDPVLVAAQAIRNFCVFYVPIFALAVAISGVVHFFNSGFPRNLAIALEIAGVVALPLYVVGKLRK